MGVQGQVLKLHQALYVKTDGRIGHKTVGVPTLLLRSTGARSGETRTNALMYVRDGDRYIVVASKGGAPTAPAWLHNVRAHPDVEVQIGRKRSPAKATEIARGDADYERLFKLADDNNHGRFAAYQEKTTRPIPLVALTPAQ